MSFSLFVPDHSLSLTLCFIATFQGNEENRVVIFDNKIVDYINFILRTGQFAACGLEKALQLLEIIGDLLMSLIEENHPDALAIAREVADCLDKEALLRFMTECYNLSRVSRPVMPKVTTYLFTVQF
jgi:hypothetical protein